MCARARERFAREQARVGELTGEPCVGALSKSAHRIARLPASVQFPAAAARPLERARANDGH